MAESRRLWDAGANVCCGSSYGQRPTGRERRATTMPTRPWEHRSPQCKPWQTLRRARFENAVVSERSRTRVTRR